MTNSISSAIELRMINSLQTQYITSTEVTPRFPSNRVSYRYILDDVESFATRRYRRE